MPRKNVQEERRTQILGALHRCLLRKPFHQTSVRDIAREAGVNHGVLHYYFKSKEDVLLNYIDEMLVLYKSQFNEWMAGKSPLHTCRPDFIPEFLDFMIERITLNRELSHVYIEIWEIAAYNAKVRKKLQRSYIEWVETVTGVLRPMVDEQSARRFGRAMVAFYEGIAMLSIVMRKGEFPVADVLRWYRERILSLLEAEATGRPMGDQSPP